MLARALSPSRPNVEIAGVRLVPSTGPVAELTLQGPSDKVATCSYQINKEKHCLVVHTKQLLETLYLLRGNACEVAGRASPSLLKMLILAVGSRANQEDLAQFPLGGQTDGHSSRSLGAGIITSFLSVLPIAPLKP